MSDTTETGDDKPIVLTKEAIAKAAKKAKDSPENVILVKISYDQWLILPYKAGTMLLQALENAQVLNQRYGSRPQIKELERDLMPFEIMSAAEITRIRMANLLNVSVDDLKQFETI